MRFNWAAAVLIAFLSALACGEKAGANLSYVTAPSGLVLRESPATDGKRLQLIPYATGVEVLEVQAQSETIGDRQGKWTRVQHADASGWVFGAYLSATAPGAAELRCYSVASETFDGKIELRFYPENVKGELRGTVHDEANGYFTAYKSTINGTRSGEILNVKLVTHIELDVQNSSESWKLAGKTLSTETHTYFQADCAAEASP
ncbi:MAG: SH3 domain-containing protein [bacterium]|nr:SH3 domain-containing protein [bacterium]